MKKFILLPLISCAVLLIASALSVRADILYVGQIDSGQILKYSSDGSVNAGLRKCG